MPFLLSTQALLDLSTNDDGNPVVRWSASVDLDYVYISVIAAGQVQAEINRLPESDPIKLPLHRNLRALLDDFSHPRLPRLLAVDLAVVRRWIALYSLDLTARSPDGTERSLDRASRLVVATALDKGYDLVEEDQPYHAALNPHGLQTAAPVPPDGGA